MPLPWVRLDSNIASHDKILALLEHRDGAKAAFSYCCSLGYCGGHGTDGLIKFNALPFIHCTKHYANLLVTAELWIPDAQGWRIPKWGDRQEMSNVTEVKRAAQSLGGMKGNCIKYHGADCGCWAK